jgi:hypothetical protein
MEGKSLGSGGVTLETSLVVRGSTSAAAT